METGYIKLLYLLLHKSITMANHSADGTFCYKLLQHLLFYNSGIFKCLQSFHIVCINFIYSDCIIFTLQRQYRSCTDTMSNSVQFKSRAEAMKIIQSTSCNLQWQMHEKKQHIIIIRRRKQKTKDCGF